MFSAGERQSSQHLIWVIAWDPARYLRVVTMQNVFALGTGQYRHEREVHTQRPYPAGGVVELLVRCGFHVYGVLDAMSLTVVTSETSRAIYVARNLWTEFDVTPPVARA